MAHIVLAYDPGTSESKLIYQVDKQRPQLEFIPPDYVELPNSFARTQNEEISSLAADPLERAWFSLSKKGECILVGQLAAERGFSPELGQPKYVTLTYKIVGMLCAIAVREELKSPLTADVLALLPVGEFGDAVAVKSELERILDGNKKIYFQGQPLQIKMEVFQALPEGGGIVLKTSECQKGQTAILMLGYRNASILAFDKGSFNKGRSASKNLGFYQLADKILAEHSYLSREDVLAAVHIRPDTARDLEKWKSAILPQRLVRVAGKEREREEKRLAQTIELATVEYLKLLFNWLVQVLAPVSNWQHICVVGGTGHLFSSEIEAFFADYNKRVDWCSHIVVSTLRQFSKSEFHYGDRLTAIRAADVKAAFESFLESVAA